MVPGAGTTLKKRQVFGFSPLAMFDCAMMYPAYAPQATPIGAAFFTKAMHMAAAVA